MGYLLNADDFLAGQRDCQSGKKHESGRSTSYDRGYSTQYAHEANLSEISLQVERLKELGRTINRTGRTPVINRGNV